MQDGVQTVRAVRGGGNGARARMPTHLGRASGLERISVAYGNLPAPGQGKVRAHRVIFRGFAGSGA